MAIFKCKMCGGSLNTTDKTVAICEYCGTQQTIPKTTDEVVSNLFNRANNLRLKCEFDKAAQIYEKIVEQDDSESEAHWGLVLCKYGIEYVEDPKTNQRIPTCHRTLFEAVTADADYQAAIDYSDAAQQAIYEKEARAIDKIQKDIFSIVKNEKPFDVFICYKETDESGKRTVDSAIANDIYHQLTQEGFKVFYAAITLEDKLGQEYEPYIFAALNSAKVMLALGTKPEYFSAVWVKNEWSRFMHLMKTDRSKLLIPCYRDMDAYDLPEEFAHLQAQDMGKIGFINDVIRGIKKIATAESPTTVVKETVVSSGNINTAPLLKRAFLFLEDGDFDRADEFCEQVLNQDPENAQAYLGKLMVVLNVKTPEQLKHCEQPFDNENYYLKAVRFADEKLKSTLIAYISHINTRNENARLERVYKYAELKMVIGTECSLREAGDSFNSIRNYRDSESKAKECHEKAEAAHKDKILSDAQNIMRKGDISDYSNAIALLNSISDWKNANKLVDVCNAKIEELKVKEEAERLEQARKAEVDRLERERKAEAARKKAKRNKKIVLIVTLIVCAAIAFVVVLDAVIIPNCKYNKAIALMNEGNIIEAYETFVALDGYRDSSDKANSIYDMYKVERLKVAKVGEHVFFGTYEQDANTSNGGESIEWLVLEVKNGKVLVISEYALDVREYDTNEITATWETCTLRTWLNNEFINSAFSSGEKSMIPTVTVSADKNPEHDTSPGKATLDQVFLLSIAEVDKYFNSDDELECKPTNYAVSDGVYHPNFRSNCPWWLRSPGSWQYTAAYVRCGDGVNKYGLDINNSLAVRPAMWIDLSEVN